MKYTNINISSNKEFEKNMTEFGERMSEFGAKMASFGSKVSNNIFDIFDESNGTSYMSQNGTSTIIKDNKTIINTFDDNEIVLENGEIFLNGKKMKVDENCENNNDASETTSKNSNDSMLKKYESRFEYLNRWLAILTSLMIGLIIAFLTFIFIS